MSAIPYSRYIIYPVPWYSFLIVTGIILAVFLAAKEEKRVGLPRDTVLDLALWLLPCGIVGARLYYVVFSWDHFSNDLLSVFRIWEGGIAIYGGVIGGMAALLVFAHHRRISPLILCDIIVPGLALAQSIGRWGNWFNIEAYGMKVTNEALCFFPFAVQVPADGSSWHFASFFFESVWDFFIFVFLIAARRRLLRNKGDIFSFYLFLYAAGRFVIEETRTDSLYISSSVRISQLLSILLCITVFIRYMVIARKQGTLPRFSVFFLFPLFMSASFMMLYYSLCGSFIFSLSSLQSILLMAVFAIVLIAVLFLFRFSGSSGEVCNADN